jgi:integrase/recombinase XerD
METNKLSILFLIDKVKQNQKGTAPIRCRLTFKGIRKIFSTGLFIIPEYWNSKLQKALPPKEETNFINSQLSLIRTKFNQAFLLLQYSNESFDVDDIYLTYKGENIKKEKGIMELLQLHNQKMLKLVGVEYARKYYLKFTETEGTLKGFLKSTYNKTEFQLGKLTLKFLDDYDYYLKSEKGLKQISINKNIQRIRKVIKLAISENYLQHDPFILYKPKRVTKHIVYLTQEELKSLEEYNFSQQRLEQIRDLFIFCCYTGLAYMEMSSLKQENIIKGFDGNLWINMYRQKTKKQFSVPLLDKANLIIEKYSNSSNKESLLPVISNQKFNSYIKEVADIVGINKKLTHHIARKTFATTVLLYNDVPIEIVSELLGHSKITVTQEHYAKVVQKKVGEQMSKLNDKMKP